MKNSTFASTTSSALRRSVLARSGTCTFVIRPDHPLDEQIRACAFLRCRRREEKTDARLVEYAVDVDFERVFHAITRPEG